MRNGKRTGQQRKSLAFSTFLPRDGFLGSQKAMVKSIFLAGVGRNCQERTGMTI